MIKNFSLNEKKQFSILLIGTQMAIGGAQIGLFDQARWFKLHGCKVAVAFFYDKEGLYKKWKKSVDFPVYDLQGHTYGDDFLHQIGQFVRGVWRLLGLVW